MYGPNDDKTKNDDKDEKADGFGFTHMWEDYDDDGDMGDDD